MSGKVTCVPLGGPDHHVGPDGAPVGSYEARFNRPHSGLLVDGSAKLFDGFGQASDQAARVDGCHVGVEPSAGHVGGVTDCPGLVGSDPSHVVVGEAYGMAGTNPGGDAVSLDRAAGQVDPAARLVVAVDALGIGYPTDVVDGVVQAPHLANCILRSGPGSPVHGTDAVLAEGPSTVSTRGAVAGHLPLQNHHPYRRVQAEQVVGGPEAGVAGADDGDVGLSVAG